MSDISTRIVISAKDDASGALKKISAESDNLNQSWQGVKNVLGVGIAAFGISSLAGLAGQVVTTTQALNAAGSQAQETANKFNVVFADINETATSTAKSLASNYGMAYESAQASLSSVGDLLTGLGVSSGKALDLAEQTVQLGTDLASFTNYAGGASGAVEALTSAMLGETEAAKSLGLVLQDDQMEKYAASVGKVWSKLGITEKAQLRLNAAIAQSPNAVGDFARSMDSYANQVRVAQAISQDFQNAIGEGIVPVSAHLVSVFNDNRESVDLLGQTIGGFVNSELTGIIDGYNVLNGQTTDLQGGTLGLATSFVGVAGGAKVAWNSIELVANTFIFAARAIDVGTRQIAL